MSPQPTTGAGAGRALAPVQQHLKPSNITVSFTIVTPDQLRRIIFTLTKTQASAGESWDIMFELDERADAAKNFVLVARFQVDVDQEDHDNAAATAKHGLDSDQVDQAHVAADTASDVKTGAATLEDRDAAATDVVSVRNAASPN